MNIISTDGETLSKVPDIVDIEPVGTQVLFEELTAQELQSSTLYITGSSKNGPPQGYVLKVGPKTDSEEFGFKVGDRVVLTGNYTPVPGEGERSLGLVEPHQIKAVLVEHE
jgi:co-chaperonin GroES (HSP10)